MINVIKNNFSGLGAFETTQFLRGELYVAVDTVLTQEYESEEQVDQVIEFINVVLELVVAWLRKVPSLLPLVRSYLLTKKFSTKKFE